MAVSAKIVTLYEDEAKTSAIAPRTKVSAISDEDGTSLDTLLTEKAKFIDISGAQNNLTTLFTSSGENFTLYHTDNETIGTPKQTGASTYSWAGIISLASSANYGTQLAITNGDGLFIRNNKNGTISEWKRVFDETSTIPLSNLGLTATTTELDYCDGVTSNIQTQLNGKQATIGGGASTITSDNLTASRALISNSSGKVAVSAVTSTELGYLDGVTSKIQTQLDAKVPKTAFSLSGTTLTITVS